MSQELKDKLKLARLLAGLSQSQAAAAWSVPLKTLISWENDARTPRGFTLNQLNAMLDGVIATHERPAPAPSASRSKRKSR